MEKALTTAKQWTMCTKNNRGLGVTGGMMILLVIFQIYDSLKVYSVPIQPFCFPLPVFGKHIIMYHAILYVILC